MRNPIVAGQYTYDHESSLTVWQLIIMKTDSSTYECGMERACRAHGAWRLGEWCGGQGRGVEQQAGLTPWRKVWAKGFDTACDWPLGSEVGLSEGCPLGDGSCHLRFIELLVQPWYYCNNEGTLWGSGVCLISHQRTTLIFSVLLQEHSLLVISIVLYQGYNKIRNSQ